MPKFSLVVPVYNRPDEVRELLQSLVDQSYPDFEVLVVEDGSTIPCDHVVDDFQSQLSISYFRKENTGQGFTRNYGFERSSGTWLIVCDSDCIFPQHYFGTVEAYLSSHEIDAYGGPDKAHATFSPVQKAISYSMTSFLTTGGIRGKKRIIGPFHPRSFNMGITREIFEKTGGYVLPRRGEDIEFSIRIIRSGFKTAFIPEAYVYHKRRTSFRQFYRQLHFFGSARINVFRHYPEELKLVHLFPSLFVAGMIVSLMMLLAFPRIGVMGLSIYGCYAMAIFLHATLSMRSLTLGILGVVASVVQLTAYGLGLISEWLVYVRKG